MTAESLPPVRVEPAAEATLCTHCGLCCDGTLYGQVALDGPSHGALPSALLRRGFTILSQGDATAFKQPCPALCGTLCDIYEERPPACARYACALRKRVAEGRTDLVTAERIVARARALTNRVREGLRLGDSVSLWEGITALEPPTDETKERAWAEAHAGAIDAVSALIALVRAEFEPRFAGGEAPSQSSTEPRDAP